MKLSTLSSKLITAATAAFAAFAVSAATVDSVIVRQMWPWSTDIKVEYRLSGVGPSHPVDISVRAFNDGVEIGAGTLLSAISGERYGVTNSIGTLTIDPTIAFGSSTIALGSFTVQLSVSDYDPKMNDILYKIVDLDEPYTVTDVRRHDFYDGKYGNYVTNFSDIAEGWTTSLDDVLIWTGVTEDDTYRTSKMVFRRIPAAGKSFQFQKGIAAATNAYYGAGEGIKVSFTKDYYIGVFPVTQAQFMKMADQVTYRAFLMTNQLYSATRPSDNIGYHNSDASGVALHNRWETFWPTSTSHKKAANSMNLLVPAMQYKTGLLVDMPTEARWEYACRAGTDTFKYSGETGDLAYGDSFVSKAARCSSSKVSAYNRNNADTSCTAKVGSYKPNAWGLYDMIGNVQEFCLDLLVATSDLWKQSCYSQEDNVDPVGPTASSITIVSARVARGGDWRNVPPTSGSMQRTGFNGTLHEFAGVRLCIYLDENDDGTFLQ